MSWSKPLCILALTATLTGTGCSVTYESNFGDRTPSTSATEISRSSTTTASVSDPEQDDSENKATPIEGASETDQEAPEQATTTSTPSSTSTVASDEPTSTTQPTSADAEPSKEKAVPEGSGCTPGGELSDGVWYGYMASRSENSIDFDLICYYRDEQASLAALEDNNPDEVGFDDYTRNTNSKLRTLSVSSDTPVQPVLGAEQTVFPNWEPYGYVIEVTTSGGEVVEIVDLFHP